MNVTIMNLNEITELLNKLVEENNKANVSFKVGQKVKIRGSFLDATEHLDGEIGTIIEVRIDDCKVELPEEVSMLTWWIWNENMEVVENV